MLDWWLAPIDAARPHEVAWRVSRHARVMVVAWGGLVPVGILAARFFRVLPGQDGPRELDNRAWRDAHRAAQYSAGALMLAGLAQAWVWGAGASTGRAGRGPRWRSGGSR